MKRSRRLVVACIAIYLVGSAVYLAQRSYADTKSAVGLLRQGEEQLLSDPAQATDDFSASQTAAQQSLGSLRSAPWWSRLVTAVPPLRWQVELAKASYELADAGQTSLKLQQSLAAIPPVREDSDSNALLAVGNQYLAWYGTQAGTVSRLAADTAEAQSNLNAIPAWTFLDQARDFRRLETQVSSLTTAIRADGQLGQESTAFAKAGGTIDIELLPASKDPGSLLVVTAASGSLSALTFQALPQNLVTAYVHDSQTAAFWPGINSSGTLVTVDPSAVTRLLDASGTIQLGGVDRPSVRAKDWTSSDLGYGDFFPRLILTLVSSASERSRARSALVSAADDQAIRISGGQSEWAGIATQLPDALPPSPTSNWLRLVPESGTAASMEISQQRRWWLGDTVQTVTVTDTAKPKLALSYVDSPLDSVNVRIASGYDVASFTALGDDRYRLRYVVPQETADPSSIEVLPPLAGSLTVSAFGGTQAITSDTVLTP